MEIGETAALFLIGLIVLGLAYLASEIQRLREQLEPLVTSPLVQAASRIGV